MSFSSPSRVGDAAAVFHLPFGFVVCAFGSFVCDSVLVCTEAIVAGLVLVGVVSTGAPMLSVDGLLPSVMSVLIFCSSSRCLSRAALSLAVYGFFSLSFSCACFSLSCSSSSAERLYSSESLIPRFRVFSMLAALSLPAG